MEVRGGDVYQFYPRTISGAHELIHETKSNSLQVPSRRYRGVPPDRIVDVSMGPGYTPTEAEAEYGQTFSFCFDQSFCLALITAKPSIGQSPSLDASSKKSAPLAQGMASGVLAVVSDTSGALMPQMNRVNEFYHESMLTNMLPCNDEIDNLPVTKSE